jgi:hypothetical protein
MTCQRCRQGQAVARVRSEILDLAVCADCVLEAKKYVGPAPDELNIAGYAEKKAVAMPAA